MKIYIEAVMLLVIPIVILLWWIWNRMCIRKAWKKYKPNDDKSRQGEESRGGRVSSFKESELSSPRFAQLEKRELLEAAGSGVSRKDNSISRNPFKRRKK